MLPRSQPWDIFFYHVQILLRSVGHVRATESNRQGKHIYHRKEKLSQQSWDQNQEEKKVFGKNMLEMVGENNQKEKKKTWSESRGSGKALSLLCKKRHIDHKTWPQGSCPTSSGRLDLPTASRELFNFSSCPVFSFFRHQPANAFLIIPIFWNYFGC